MKIYRTISQNAQSSGLALYHQLMGELFLYELIETKIWFIRDFV